MTRATCNAVRGLALKCNVARGLALKCNAVRGFMGLALKCNAVRGFMGRRAGAAKWVPGATAGPPH